MEFVEMRAYEYAKDIMNFVLDRYRMRYKLIVRHPSIFQLSSYPGFNPNVGRVILTFMHSPHCRDIQEGEAYLVTNITSLQLFDRFVRNFSMPYLKRHPCDDSLLRVFATIIELTVTFVLLNKTVLDAPKIATHIIADILLEAENGTFIADGGLSVLNAKG